MAIQFVRALVQNIDLKSGVCGLIAYICRSVVRDHRLDNKRFDFRHHRADLADFEIVAPPGMPDAPETPAEFGQLVDKVEAPAKPHRDRKRWPQGSVHLIFALPTRAEACLDECVAMIHALVGRISHGHAVVWMFAIHDLLMKRQDGHRHAHIAMMLREWLPNGEWSNRLRGLLGEVRYVDGPHGRFLGTVERRSWPDEARDAQILVFQENGLSGVVDPIAPVPQRHFSPREWWENPAVVDAELRGNHELNRAVIQGDAVKLVETMLRERASFPIREIETLAERFLDTQAEQREFLDRIITHPALVLLGPPSGGTVHVTTRASLAQTEEARDWVRTASQNDPPGIAVVRGNGPKTTLRNLRRTCRDAFPAVPPEDGLARRFLIVDDHRSVAEKLSLAIHDLEMQAETVADAIESPELLSAETILIVPRLDCVRDAPLAALLARARHAGARVLAGFDESRPQAIVSFRLAAWIAQQVTPMVKDPRLDARGQAARLLRAGAIAPALDQLAQAGLLKFDDDVWLPGGSAITVVDDARLLRQLTRAETKAETLTLHPHDMIVFTATDFSEVPPVVREKNIARVVSANPERSTLTVDILGTERTIELDEFPHVRSAEMLTLSEARRAPQDTAMNVTMSSERHGYACAVLAAIHPSVAQVRVSAGVAHDVAGLAQVIERNLAVPLLGELEPRPTLRAEANVGVAEVLEDLAVQVGPEVDATLDERRVDDIAPAEAITASSEFEDPLIAFSLNAVDQEIAAPILADDAPYTVDLEPLRSVSLTTTHRPSSAATKTPVRKPLPARLASDMRRAVTGCIAAREGFDQLYKRLATDAPERLELAERIRSFVGEDSPTAKLLAALLPEPRPKRHRNDWDEVEPVALLSAAQSQISDWEGYRIRIDLSLMGSTERFEAILAGPEVPDQEPDLPAPGF